MTAVGFRHVVLHVLRVGTPIVRVAHVAVAAAAPVVAVVTLHLGLAVVAPGGVVSLMLGVLPVLVGRPVSGLSLSGAVLPLASVPAGRARRLPLGPHEEVGEPEDELQQLHHGQHGHAHPQPQRAADVGEQVLHAVGRHLLELHHAQVLQVDVQAKQVLPDVGGGFPEVVQLLAVVLQ